MSESESAHPSGRARGVEMEASCVRFHMDFDESRGAHRIALSLVRDQAGRDQGDRRAERSSRSQQQQQQRSRRVSTCVLVLTVACCVMLVLLGQGV